MNYIEFFIKEDKPVARIHKNGKALTITNKKRIRKLIEICKKHGIEINEECTITDNVLLIAHEYEEYRIKEKRNNIQVVGEIKPNMKVSRNNSRAL